MIHKPAHVAAGEKKWGKSYSARYDAATFRFIEFVDGYGHTVAEDDMHDFIEFHRDQANYWRMCVEEFRQTFRAIAPIYAEWD
ncbi:hypothetical protein [Nocardia jiangxiensis]|uniref:hypothetical protein n=1 Tax=Nocardia jiangxiensis TaxID=282685 RepID=UPI0002FA84A0|nr:hypothetical protein [Nocardia jiangxiensis]